MDAGVDTHRDTVAVSVLNNLGQPIKVCQLSNTRAGFKKVGTCWPNIRWTGSALKGRGTTGGRSLLTWPSLAASRSSRFRQA
jgi:hypothetical protein